MLESDLNLMINKNFKKCNCNLLRRKCINLRRYGIKLKGKKSKWGDISKYKSEYFFLYNTCLSNAIEIIQVQKYYEDN